LRQATLEVYEISGRKLTTLQLTGAQTTIDLDAFSRGLYLYTIFDVTHKPLCNGKIIVQH
ncbi:MAG TPA: T9SS type A sorting domain-containing protein, partial [Bacteroidia bacterium]|nr:T9SS type A sorting domain-containing protein [Bacteroidia bacterium]